MKPVGVQHVSIGVHDLAASIKFYNLLGMTVVPTRPTFSVDGAWMQAGAQQVHLIVSDKPTPGLENHFAVIVDNLQACLDELSEQGVDAFRLKHVQGAGNQAFINDPSGNVIELNEPD
ncbi:MAG: VOC family protein [Actinomycetota bacterium]|jgi:glyoxylase I family protein